MNPGVAVRRAWARAAVVAAVVAILFAGGSGGMRGAAAAPTPEGWPAIAQADTSGAPADETEEEADEEEVPIPQNLLEPGPGTAPPDTTLAPRAGSDSTAAPSDTTRADSLGTVIPFIPAQPETLFSVPPGSRPGATDKPGAAAPVVAPKGRGGLLGLTPAVVILGLALIHILVIRSVN